MGVIASVLPGVALAAAPSPASVSINDGATYTNTRNVTLHLAAKHCHDSNDQWKMADMAVRVSDTSSTWGTMGSDVSVTWSGAGTEGTTGCGTAAAPTSTLAWELPVGADGTRTVYVMFRHGATGESLRTDTIILDSTAPVVAFVTPAASGTSLVDSVDVTVSAIDATSGVASVEVRVGTGAWVAATAGTSPNYTRSAVALACGDNVVGARATDAASNTSTPVTITLTYNCSTDTVRGAPAIVNEALNGDAGLVAECTPLWGTAKSKLNNWRGMLISSVAHWAAANEGFTEQEALDLLHSSCFGSLRS